MSSHRVLLADPDPLLAASYQKVLSAEGFEVDVAASAPECVDKLRTFSPDLLVLEPEMSGGADDVLNALESNRNGRGVRVMVLAEGRDLEKLARAAAHHVDEWRDKPVPPERLAASVRRLLS